MCSLLPLVVLLSISLKMLSAFRGVRRFLASPLSKLPKTSHHAFSTTTSQSPLPEFTHKDLPSETLYVLDGTAMLFQAFFSREAASPDMADACFTDDFAAKLLSKMSPAQRAIWESAEGSPTDSLEAEDIDIFSIPSNEILSASVTSPATIQTNTNNDKKTRPMSCAALTVMGLHFARFIREVQPAYLAVTFDVSRATLIRSKLLPSYKQQRPQTPPTLLPQFAVAPALLSAFGCQVLALPGHEADDLMASLSRWARHRGLCVALVSQDKDLWQLAATGVHILHPKTLTVAGPEDVVRKYGVQPAQIPDLFALSGDAADNIKGARHIGLKTATSLIAAFGSIENLYAELQLSALPAMQTCDEEEQEKEEEKGEGVEENDNIYNNSSSDNADKISDKKKIKKVTMTAKEKKLKVAQQRQRLVEHYSLLYTTTNNNNNDKDKDENSSKITTTTTTKDDGNSTSNKDGGPNSTIEGKTSWSLAAHTVDAALALLSQKLPTTRVSVMTILLSLAELGVTDARLYKTLVTLEDRVQWVSALLDPVRLSQHRHNDDDHNAAESVRHNSSNNSNNSQSNECHKGVNDNNNDNNDNDHNSSGSSSAAEENMSSAIFRFTGEQSSVRDVYADHVRPSHHHSSHAQHSHHNNNDNDKNSSNENNNKNKKHVHQQQQQQQQEVSRWLKSVSPSLLKPLQLLRQQYHKLDR